jgi:GNAT superfamily N-acetyltransferase
MRSTPMDRTQVLELYDRERRREPVDAGVRLEQVGPVYRVVGSYNCIVASELDASTAPMAVADQAADFRARGEEVEWKVHATDRPENLPELLRAAGFVPEPTETLMVFDLAQPLRVGSRSTDLTIRPVTDLAGLDEAVRVSGEAFAPEGGWRRDEYARRLTEPGFMIYLAEHRGRAIAAGRLEMPPGCPFASLWGGGTSPDHRGLGAYRALVEARGEEARRRGFRYVTVDALETSRPILERIGFEPLTTMTAWVLRPS